MDEPVLLQVDVQSSHSLVETDRVESALNIPGACCMELDSEPWHQFPQRQIWKLVPLDYRLEYTIDATHAQNRFGFLSDA